MLCKHKDMSADPQNPHKAGQRPLLYCIPLTLGSESPHVLCVSNMSSKQLSLGLGTHDCRPLLVTRCIDPDIQILISVTWDMGKRPSRAFVPVTKEIAAPTCRTSCVGSWRLSNDTLGAVFTMLLRSTPAEGKTGLLETSDTYSSNPSG